MIRRSLVVAVVVASFVPAVLTAQANRDAAAKAIEANERAVITAIQKGDAKGFLAGVTPDAIAMDQFGINQSSEFPKLFGQYKVASWSLDQVKVIFQTDSAAIITYKLNVKATFNNQPIPPVMWVSSAYANRNGKWLSVFHQETVAVTPPPMKK